MSELYGIYIIISMLCIWFYASELLSKRTSKAWLVQLLSCGLVICLFIFQNYYRLHYCAEAEARKELQKIVYYWEEGRKDKAIARLEHWNGNSKPWEYCDDEPLENNGPGLY